MLLLLLERGWRLTEPVKAKSVTDAINSVSPNRAVAVAGDLLKDGYVEHLVKKAAEFGNGKIHIIVNNAGFTWDGVVHKVRLQHSQQVKS